MEQQHGDVLIKKIDCLPLNTTKILPKSGKHIVAEGETTGHMHSIADIENSDLFEDENGVLYLRCQEEVTITHEEHAPQIIKRGIYEIGKVATINPFLKKNMIQNKTKKQKPIIRSVAD